MRWRTGATAFLLGLATAALASTGAEASDSVAILNLGDFQPTSIARDGRVAGRVNWSPAIYQAGQPLSMPDPEHGYGAAVISPGGTVAYSGGRPMWYSGSAPTAHVVRDGNVQDAGTATNGPLAGGDAYSIPHSVNDAGTVAGESHAFGRWNRAFTSSYDVASGTYKPVAMGANGGSTSNAFGINGQGTVVGTSDVATQWRNHAFVGTPSNDIGTLGGANSEAHAINDNGLVVGWSGIAKTDGYNEFKHAFLYDSGGMRDLGTLDGADNSRALAINALGQAVGDSGGLAVLFQDGKVIDLNSFLPSDTGWILQTAVGINDIGQIIGTGTLDGRAQSYLLSLGSLAVPAPEPSTWALFAAAAIGLVGYRLRRK